MEGMAFQPMEEVGFEFFEEGDRGLEVDVEGEDVDLVRGSAEVEDGCAGEKGVGDVDFRVVVAAEDGGEEVHFCDGVD